jgi:hypothetical protein
MQAANEIKFNALKCEIAKGLRDLDQRRFQTYGEGDLMRLVDDVCQNGKTRLSALGLKLAAKVQKKK